MSAIDRISGRRYDAERSIEGLSTWSEFDDRGGDNISSEPISFGFLYWVRVWCWDSVFCPLGFLPLSLIQFARTNSACQTKNVSGLLTVQLTCELSCWPVDSGDWFEWQNMCLLTKYVFVTQLNHLSQQFNNFPHKLVKWTIISWETTLVYKKTLVIIEIDELKKS